MLNVSQSFINKFNDYVRDKTPFVFLIDFEGEKPVLFKLSETAKNGFYFQTPAYKNIKAENKKTLPDFESFQIDFNHYRKAFEIVQQHLHKGNTYLLNLTFKTSIKTSYLFKDIFCQAVAPYKIYYKDKFVCFSPETFVKIIGNKITTYPMKGTIDAGLPNAKSLLLSSQKETYEHNTIVDLLRNDLSQVATNIEVTKFKYLDKIKTNRGQLWQMSSEISGLLPENWHENAAQTFLKLLPAGSVSGAPKKKTLEIIKSAENKDRGYYTGIFGYFDGKNFDTAVLIRYIETDGSNYYYRSGGGITALSNLEDEYNELIQKIYVPVNRDH